MYYFNTAMEFRNLPFEEGLRVHAALTAWLEKYEPLPVNASKREEAAYHKKMIAEVGKVFGPGLIDALHLSEVTDPGAEAMYRASREKRTLKAYGKTLDQYDEQLGRQGGCGLCHRQPERGETFHWDHDHRCCPGPQTCGNCVRGLLCGGCNAKLGVIEKILQLGVLDDFIAWTSRRMP